MASLRRKPLCIICMDRERGTLLSCGHSNLCANCIQKLPTQVCPTCRTPITSVSLTPLHGSYQRNIHLLDTDANRAASASTASPPQLNSSSTALTAARPANAPTPHTKTILFVAPPSVPIIPLFCALRQSFPSKRSPHQQHCRDNSIEISINSRIVKLTAHVDTGHDIEITDMIRRTRPKLVVMCCCKSRIGTFERMVRTDIGLLQKDRGRSPPRVWAILDKGPSMGRRMSHVVETADLKAAWHYLGTPRFMVNVELGGNGKTTLRKLAALIGMYVGVPLPPQPSGRLTLNDGQAAQSRCLFRSLLCLE